MYTWRQSATAAFFIVQVCVCMLSSMHKQQDEKLATCRFVNSLVLKCRIFHSFFGFFSIVNAVPTKKSWYIQLNKKDEEWRVLKKEENDNQRNKTQILIVY